MEWAWLSHLPTPETQSLVRIWNLPGVRSWRGKSPAGSRRYSLSDALSGPGTGIMIEPGLTNGFNRAESATERNGFSR